MSRWHTDPAMLIVVAVMSGCGQVSTRPAPSSPRAEQDLLEASRRYPTLFELQTDLMTKTCSPNPGVCHQSREYPELHTLGSLVAQIDAPCNVRHPNPTDGWDACERAAARLIIGPFQASVARMERSGPGEWSITVGEDAPLALDGRARFESDDGALLFEPPEGWSIVVARDEADPRKLRLVADGPQDQVSVVDSVLATIIGGDPNGNGVFGHRVHADRPARLIAPGDLEMSYLWRRLLGDVPGSAMPLANGPVLGPQFYALGCWIESLEVGATVDPDDTIDYAGCSLASTLPDLAASRE